LISLVKGNSSGKKSQSTVDFIAVSMQLAGYFKAHYCNLPFAHLTEHHQGKVFIILLQAYTTGVLIVSYTDLRPDVFF
jgi:hypothetical protein